MSDSETETMAQVVSLEDALRIVPEFDGSNIPLTQFFEGCDEALAIIQPESEPSLTKFLRAKISGEARQAISGKNFKTVSDLKDYLKSIYAPGKTIHQLLGELANEYQRESESVLTFANRVRDVAARILEMHKLGNNSKIDDTFKTTLHATTKDCFKNGLKAEIEQRLSDKQDINDVVLEAIKIERQLSARQALRKEIVKLVNNNSSGAIESSVICQICNAKGHDAKCCKSQTQNFCDNCKRPGHLTSQCRGLLTCQICAKIGHIAENCRSATQCQICKKMGHTARFCRMQPSKNDPPITCQICDRAGHAANSCFRINPPERQTTNTDICQLCNRRGHTAKTCRSQNTVQPSSSMEVCRYCKNQGHTIENCRKREFINAKKAQAFQETSAPQESPKPPMRSPNEAQINALLSELLPFE